MKNYKRQTRSLKTAKGAAKFVCVGLFKFLFLFLCLVAFLIAYILAKTTVSIINLFLYVVGVNFESYSLHDRIEEKSEVILNKIFLSFYNIDKDDRNLIFPTYETKAT